LLKATLKFVYAPYIIVTMSISIAWLLPFETTGCRNHGYDNTDRKLDSITKRQLIIYLLILMRY